MSDLYKKIFSNITEINPPERLYSSILKRVEKEKKRYLKIKLFFHSAIALISFSAIIPSFIYMSGSFTQSGFSQFVSLIFSDGATIISYWKDFALLLAESLPIFSIIVLLISMFALLGSIRYVTRDAKILMSA